MTARRKSALKAETPEPPALDVERPRIAVEMIDPPRGFSGFGEDDPLRDFMATYFDRDDDHTRAQVLDFLDRIVRHHAR